MNAVKLLRVHVVAMLREVLYKESIIKTSNPIHKYKL
jgi:hypothetical protein